MTQKIFRKYLEINNLKDLNESKKPSDNYLLKLNSTKDFQLNKFFYKQVGKKYEWVDRLKWTDQNWIDYISNKKILNFFLKNNIDLIGYFELIFYEDKKETEIAYFGILEEYFGKRLGGFLLGEAVKKSFSLGAKRVCVHTCSLDHQNALKNYLSRGMNIFKSEILKREKLI